MEYTISKENFLDWNYEVNMDETRRLKDSLANYIITQLYKTGQASLTVQELFDNCNTDAIKVYYIDGFNNADDDREFGDLKGNNTIKLK